MMPGVCFHTNQATCPVCAPQGQIAQDDELVRGFFQSEAVQRLRDRVNEQARTIDQLQRRIGSEDTLRERLTAATAVDVKQNAEIQRLLDVVKKLELSIASWKADLAVRDRKLEIERKSYHDLAARVAAASGLRKEDMAAALGFEADEE